MNDGPERASTTLGQIARVVDGELCGDPNVVVYDVTHDSRAVVDRSLFVAIRGKQADGNAFVAEAVARGACAVASERVRPDGCEIPWIRVVDARVALAAVRLETLAAERDFDVALGRLLAAARLSSSYFDYLPREDAEVTR